MAEIKEFLNPKSMITPGVAGSTIMLITNTMAFYFGFPHAWTALALSFLFAISILGYAETSFFKRAVLCLFNGLIIFSVAMGANQTISSKGKAPGGEALLYMTSEAPEALSPEMPEPKAESPGAPSAPETTEIPEPSIKEESGPWPPKPESAEEPPVSYMPEEKSFFRNWM